MHSFRNTLRQPVLAFGLETFCRQVLAAQTDPRAQSTAYCQAQQADGKCVTRSAIGTPFRCDAVRVKFESSGLANLREVGVHG